MSIFTLPSRKQQGRSGCHGSSGGSSRVWSETELAAEGVFRLVGAEHDEAKSERMAARGGGEWRGQTRNRRYAAKDLVRVLSGADLV